MIFGPHVNHGQNEKHSANTSLSGFTNSGIRVKRADNVILRNLYLHNAPSKKDLVELQYSTNVWIDHNDFSSNGITGDKDAYDGLLDITHGSDGVTVSWNKFHDHWKVGDLHQSCRA